LNIIIKPLGIACIVIIVIGLSIAAFRRPQAAVETSGVVASAAPTAHQILVAPADPAKWTLEAVNGAKATLSKGDGGDTGDLQLSVQKKTGVDWNVTLYRGGLTFKDGDTVTIRYKARAVPAQTLKIWAATGGAAGYHEIWKDWGMQVNYTPQWQDYSFTFKAMKPALNDSRAPVFSMGNGSGTLYLKDVSVEVK